MARRRFRRRRRVTWLPTNGTALDIVQGTPDIDVTPFQSVISHNFNTSYVATEVLPLNPFDIPVEGQTTTPTLAAGRTLNDVIGNEYIVERIVGNCYGGCISNDSGEGATALRAYILLAGIFVARADDNNPNLPIGFTHGNYHPGALDNTREPWMFRRTWLLQTKEPNLSTNLVTTSNQTEARSFNQLPTWTVDYHGLMTGPFFDVRSKRRIRTDERLWLVTSIIGQPMGNEAKSGIATFLTIYDMRILGALRRAQNRSNF